MNVLVIGGTSGLGLELAQRLADLKHHVTVTGRHDPEAAGLDYFRLDLSDFDSEDCARKRRRLLNGLPEIDWLIYAAGFEQQREFTELAWHEIMAALNVGIKAPLWFCHQLACQNQHIHGLPNLLIITSTSQWMPRPNEVPYAAAKAAQAHLARSLAGTDKIGKVMIAGPSGMRTEFWRNSGRDTSKDLPPSWVAETILKEWEDQSETLKAIKILGGPEEVDWRVEPMEFMS